MVSWQVSIIDLLHHSVGIIVLISNSPLVPASQEAVQDEYKHTNAYNYAVTANVIFDVIKGQ